MPTFFLKLSGTTEEQITALKSVNPDLVGKTEEGVDRLGDCPTAMYYKRLTVTPTVYSEIEVDAEGFPVVITPAVTDGPFMMIKSATISDALPSGLTRAWKTGGAPVKFYGDD